MPRRPTVLVVEDDAELLRLYGSVLKLEGLDVQSAADCLEALHALDQNPVLSAVVLDICLPGLSGLTFADELCAQHNTRRVPIIVVTGSGETLQDREFAAILRKPVDPAVLVETVQHAIRRSCFGAGA